MIERHMTLRGLHVLQTGKPLSISCNLPEAYRACSGTACDTYEDSFGAVSAESMLKDYVGLRLPTCKGCIVLMDAALEGLTIPQS